MPAAQMALEAVRQRNSNPVEFPTWHVGEYVAQCQKHGIGSTIGPREVPGLFEVEDSRGIIRWWLHACAAHLCGFDTVQSGDEADGRQSGEQFCQLHPATRTFCVVSFNSKVVWLQTLEFLQASSLHLKTWLHREQTTRKSALKLLRVKERRQAMATTSEE